MTQVNLTYRFALHQALHWVITGMMIPVIVMLFQSRGLDLSQIGVVMALWIGTTALLEVPLGSLADHYGRRRTYLLSLVVTMLGCFVLLIGMSFSWVLVSAVLLGAARAVYSGTLDAWFYDAFHQAQGKLSYHSALAKVNILLTLGLALGSLLGGWLPEQTEWHLAWFASIYDLNLLVILMASTLLFFISLGLIPRDVATVHDQPREITRCFERSALAIRCCISHQVLKRVMQTTLVFGMVLCAVENLWQPFLAGLLPSDEVTTSIFGIIAALYFVMAGLSAWLSVKVLAWFNGSHRMLLLVSRMSAGAVLLLMALTTQIETFALAYLLFFFLFTLGENSQTVLIQHSTPSDYRSTMLSISSLVVTLGGMSASLAFGFIAEHYGITMSWVIAGLLLVASSALFALLPQQAVNKDRPVNKDRQLVENQ